MPLSNINLNSVVFPLLESLGRLLKSETLIFIEGHTTSSRTLYHKPEDHDFDKEALLKTLEDRPHIYGLSQLDGHWWIITLERSPCIILLSNPQPLLSPEHEQGLQLLIQSIETSLSINHPLHQEHELQRIIENVQDAFFALDLNWTFIHLNHNAEQVLKRSREELLGSSLWEKYPLTRGTVFEREYNRALETQQPQRFEAYAKHLLAWFDVLANPTPRYLGVYFRDITELKTQRVRDALLTICKQRINDAAEEFELHAQVAISFCETFGWSRVELWQTQDNATKEGYVLAPNTAHIPNKALAPQLPQAQHALITQVPASHPAHAQGARECLYLTFCDQPSPEYTLAFFSDTFIDDGGWASLAISMRDELKQLISQRKHQLEFERLFALAHDLMCVANTKGYLVRVNPAFERVLGYSERELLSRPFSDFVHPLDKQRTQEELVHVSKHQPTQTFENRYIDVNGQVHWLSWTSSAIHQDGRIYSIAREVTEEKRQLRLESLQRKVLEKIATGDDATRIIKLLAKLFEEQDTSLYASFQLIDNTKQQLQHSASGALPEAFIARIFPLEIGPDMTTTGSSAYHRSTIITLDIGSDPKWQQHKEIAQDYGINACWAAPLLSSNDQLLGTMSIYSSQASPPNANQLSLIENASRLATIAIERAQNQSLIELLLRALDSCSDMVSISDIHDTEHIIYANRAMQQLLSYISPSTSPHRNLPYQLVSEPVSLRTTTPIHTTIELKSPQPAAPSKWLELSISPLQDPTDHHIITIARDISARVNVEEQLMEREERFRLLANATNDTLYDSSEENDVIWWSDGLTRSFGYHLPQNTSTFDFWLELIHPEDRRRVQGELNDAIADKKLYWSSEYRLIKADGDIAWVSERGVCIYDKQGQLQRLIGGISDLTQRHNNEQQLKAQAELLNKTHDIIFVLDLGGLVQFWNTNAEQLYEHSAVEALQRPLAKLIELDYERHNLRQAQVLERGYWSGEIVYNKAGKALTLDSRWTLMHDQQGNPQAIIIVQTDITERKQLEAQYLRAQRMESIGTLAGGIAHDLNNILTPILVSTDLLSDQFNDDESLEIIDDIKLAANRGADLVKQILSFARGTGSQRNPIEPSALFRDISRILRESFPRNIHIQSKLAPSLPWIEGDATQLHQVLLNLAINARDAMPQGGTLTLNAELLDIDDHYATMHPGASPGAHILISITDTGLGIPQEIQDRIFEPFFTTKPLGQGTGLGLSTVQAIIKSHGGFMTLYSEPNKGTAFKIYLPTSKDQSNTTTQTTAQLLRGRGELILLVDDESSILSVTQQTLEAFGYRVITAQDGTEAIALYAEKRQEIAVVLTDVMMPIMDGISTSRALYKLNPRVKIIAASGLNANATLTKLTDAGVGNFLPKPYTAEALLTMLRKVISG